MLPSLPLATETRDSLHRYSRVLGALRGQLSEPHPRWWHISLRTDASGLTTGPLALREPTRVIELRLDLHANEAALLVDGGVERGVGLVGDVSPAQLGKLWVADLVELGVAEVEVDDRWSAETSPVRAQEGRVWLQAFRGVGRLLADFRAGLGDGCGPVQLWPHHFDLSFEWFGRELEPTGEAGEDEDGQQAQIGFGFSTGDEGHPAPYFYANPWPFDAALTACRLPASGRWNEEGWQGSLFPYQAAREDPARLRRYFETVYTLASPALG